MTNIETRLRSLRTAPVADGPGSGELRRRAARRARRRRVAVLAAAVPVLLVAVAVAATTLGDEPADRVRTEPGPATTDPRPSPSSTTAIAPDDDTRVLGGVEGVSVDVTPRVELRDGDQVTVRVEGLERLPDAEILMCAGDVTADDAARSCTTSAVQQAGVEGQVAASAEQTVSVSRTIQITRDSPDLNQTEPYDCAAEAAGCVLAVGPFALPPRAILVPLSFVDDGPPVAPSITASPSTDLAEGEAVTVRAEGLRPNGTFAIEVCGPGQFCDLIYPPAGASSDADGALVATVTARSAVYSHEGRTDCTTSPCAIRIRDESFQDQGAAAPISFAPDVDAPVPELVIDPAGPYVPGQEVTVRGTGFPAGEVVRLGQCPAGLDTAVEERCVYPAALYAVVVETDGTFTATTDLSLGTALGPCGPDRPCHLGWVITRGPTVATAPLPTA